MSIDRITRWHCSTCHGTGERFYPPGDCDECDGTGNRLRKGEKMREHLAEQRRKRKLAEITESDR